jgi:hypothetical protein
VDAARVAGNAAGALGLRRCHLPDIMSGESLLSEPRASTIAAHWPLAARIAGRFAQFTDTSRGGRE